MPTEVLYRKWRPQRFADVSGQEIVKRTLHNALKNNKVSHAYLFSGPRGTGKTTMGRLLTKAINCEKNAPSARERLGEPCNECASCAAFTEGRALDLIELDGASNRGIDEIRKLRENAGYAPMAGEGAHKVYLIDEVHMLTDQAFNALLKTLEEPPPHIVFILATTDAHRVPATITSRCQRQDFKRIPVPAIADRLEYIASQEGITMPHEAFEVIARNATGSLRDAINLLEQICDSYGKDASIEAVRESLGLIADERAGVLAEQAMRGDLAGALATVGEVRDDGLDLRQFQKEAVARLRDLLLVQAGAQSEAALTPEQIEAMRVQLEGVPRERLVTLLKGMSLADLRQDPLSPLPLELALAEALSSPAPRAAQQAATASAPMQRPAVASRAPASPQPRAPAPRSAPARQPVPERVPPDLRRDNITGASPEDIRKLVGGKAPVIPPPSEEADEAQQQAGAGAAAAADPASDDIIAKLRPEMRRKAPKYDAYLNGSCHVVSLQDGVLTLGFYQEFHKNNVEASRALYEEAATVVLGAPTSIRCIMAAKPAKPLSTKSPLVQHAVETHGAKIVSEQ